MENYNPNNMEIGDKVRTHSDGKYHEGTIFKIINNDVATVHIQSTGELEVMYCRIVDLTKIN
jgi:hypothetical protein